MSAPHAADTAPGPATGTVTDRVSGRVTVVVIDDHPGVRTQLAGLIEAQGFDVLAAVASCADGRRAVTELRPDIAVIDNRLPDGQGVDLCVELAEPCPEVIKIIHSGAITTAEAEYAAAYGAATIVFKSVRPTELINTMRELSTPNPPPPTAAEHPCGSN